MRAVAITESNKINLVLQAEPYGCGVACLAMILGKTYDEVSREFRQNFSREGMSTGTMIDYLGDVGYSIFYRQILNYADKDFVRDEMLKPFAPVHIVAVKPFADSPDEHFVVMDRRGKFYCPSNLSDAETRAAWAIKEVIGLYK